MGDTNRLGDSQLPPWHTKMNGVPATPQRILLLHLLSATCTCWGTHRVNSISLLTKAAPDRVKQLKGGQAWTQASSHVSAPSVNMHKVTQLPVCCCSTGSIPGVYKRLRRACRKLASASRVVARAFGH